MRYSPLLVIIQARCIKKDLKDDGMALLALRNRAMSLNISESLMVCDQNRILRLLIEVSAEVVGNKRAESGKRQP